MNTSILSKPIKATFLDGMFRPEENINFENGEEVLFYVDLTNYDFDGETLIKKANYHSSERQFKKLIEDSEEDDNVDWNEIYKIRHHK